MLNKITIRLALISVIFSVTLFPAGIYKGMSNFNFNNFSSFENGGGLGTITGNVTLDPSTADRSGITVVIENTGLSDTTDAAGHFEIRNAPLQKILNRLRDKYQSQSLNR